MNESKYGTTRSASGEVLILALAVAVVLNVVAVLGLFASPTLRDFGGFYASGQAWLTGVDLYWPNLRIWAPHVLTPGRPLNVNPPLVNLAFVPLAVLPLRTAAAIWVALNFAALAGVANVIARETGTRVPAIAAIIGASAACVAGIGTGQFVWLLSVPMTLAWRAARHGNWNRAALLLGACALVKPFLAIFAAQLLIKRRFRAATRFVLAFAVVACASLLLAGIPAHRSWLRAMSYDTGPLTLLNVSIPGLFARIDLSAQSALFPWAACTAGLVAVTFTRISRAEAGADREFLALMLLVLLVAGSGWVYYLVLVAGPIVAVVRSSRRRRLALISCGLFCPPLIFSSQPGLMAGLTLYSLYLWAGLALWLVAVTEPGVAEKRCPVPI